MLRAAVQTDDLPREPPDVSGATGLSSLQDTQKKLEKDKKIERFLLKVEIQSTSSVTNSLSTSIKGVEKETKSEGGFKGGSINKVR